jgi:7-carboxy-7-deazaguanine synthase
MKPRDHLDGSDDVGGATLTFGASHHLSSYHKPAVYEEPIAPSGSRHELRVSEFFRSIQGEGASAGEPCVFVRLAHCNLRCQWCDTRYSWDWQAFDYHSEVRVMSIDDAARAVVGSGESRLVITGGEPLLQQANLARLLGRLTPELVVEVETNGTVVPESALLERVDQWNVSPKLAGSAEPRERRIVPEALDALSRTGRAWLKIVVSPADDIAEAEELVARLQWPRDRVLLMPEASDPRSLAERMPDVRRLALAAGLGVSERLHVERFGGERGR